MSQTLIPPSLSSSTLSEKSNLLNPPSPFFSNPTFRHRWHSRNRACYCGGIVCDVSVRAQREELMSTVSTLFDGKLNILINIVGRNIPKSVVDFTAAGFSTLMATNFESVFHMSQLAYPPLIASGVGALYLPPLYRFLFH
nr:tropinone reductase like, chloroplastic [Quercus suber]